MKCIICNKEWEYDIMMRFCRFIFRDKHEFETCDDCRMELLMKLNDEGD